MNILHWAVEADLDASGLLRQFVAMLGSSGRCFHLFPLLPFELRMRIWFFCIPGERILTLNTIYQWPGSQSGLLTYPSVVLRLMHVDREAREEMIRTYCVFNIPTQRMIVYERKLPYLPRDLLNATMRWNRRGSICMNIRQDYLFFDRLTLASITRWHAPELVPAVLLALPAIQHLAFSMNSWSKCRHQWMRILRCLTALKEIVFVFEEITKTSPHEPKFIELYDVDVPDYLDMTALWRWRILEDVRREKTIFPDWVVPKISFQGIANKEARDQLEEDLCIKG